MTGLSLDALFQRRLGHPLTADEERYVRAYMPISQERLAGDEAARAVAILAKTGDPRFRADLIRVMNATEDPFVAAWALKGLVRFLNETANHIPKLIELCRRTHFDEHGHAQHVAVQLAADVLAEQDSPVLMKALIEIAENPEQSVVLRQDAVASLSLAVERLLEKGEDMPETGAEILVLAREQISSRHN